MVKMKPGFFSIFFKSYNVGMLTKYMLKLKEETPEDLVKVCENHLCEDGHSTIKEVSQGDVLMGEIIHPFKQTGMGSVAPYNNTMKSNEGAHAIELRVSALEYEKSPHFEMGKYNNSSKLEKENNKTHDDSDNANG